MSLLNSLASVAMNAATGQGQNSGGLDAQAMMQMARQLLEHSGGLQGLVGKLQLGGLADVLPGLIDKLTPDGQLPADGDANALQGLLGGQAGDMVGMLGGLLKR